MPLYSRVRVSYKSFYRNRIMEVAKIFLSILLVPLLLLSCNSSSSLRIDNLQCDKLNNPMGIDNVSPGFSWVLTSEEDGDKQTAYQILAATDKSLLTEQKADLWNTGKVDRNNSTWIIYQGKKLSSKTIVYWKVRVWDKKGKVTDWSKTACFGIGLINPEDWKAEYIGLDTEEPQSPLLKKSFRLNDKKGKALLHVNSLGYHEIYLNGKKVGDAVLTPAVSQFNKRSLVVTYDVSDQLNSGKNDLVIWLGKGWYRNRLPGVVDGGPFVRAQLEISHYGDNRTELVTDSSWKGRESGYISTGSWRPHQFGGEVIDAQNVLSDLTSQSLNAVVWNSVKTVNIPEHKVSPQMVELNRIQKSIHPVSCKASGDTAWIFDMGTNLTGFTKIQFPQLIKGQKVRISYCDFLDDKNEFRDKLYEDYYIASGSKSAEIFENKFNYHAYRYLKLSNVKEAPELSDITAGLVHTDYSGNSTFACSDKDMNSIHDMIQYTLRCLTLGGYMVDCPQIERLGYGGDGNASALTAQTMFNLTPLYANWMQAWADCMREGGSMPHTAPNPYNAGGGPFWCGFIITASWQTYMNYGDRSLLDKYYPFMQQWLEYAEKYMVNGLLKKWPNTDYRNWYLGDWATPKGIDQTDSLSVDLVNNSFMAVCYETMGKIATLLNKSEDHDLYQYKSDELKKLIHSTFYDAERQSYSTGTQIDLIYPMLVGATPKNLEKSIQKTLYKETESRFTGHLSTGLVGIPIITQWAVQNRQAEWMYQMLKKRTYPGYLYMIDHGATTTWEHWNGERSHIHNCYNGIGSWFYQALGGILPDEKEPGYKHIFIKPQLIKDITWVETSKDTPYGTLKVRWEKTNTSFLMDIQVPVGSYASVELPVQSSKTLINGNESEDKDSFELQSGNYKIECTL